jgi:exonuclease SbcD
MNKIKILQFGDVHFDTPFRELGYNDAEKRKEDIRETFGRIIRIAEEENVHIILIPGDLFDNCSVENSTIDYIVKMFNSIPDIKVFIAPGNHDPINNRSFYRIIKWPSNVHVFKEELEKVYLEQLGACIYGIGFSKNHIENSLLCGFKADSQDYINLMVMHGDINSEGKSIYNPIKEEEIKYSELDYIAFGHKHSYSGISRAGSTFWAYAGNPEGRGFDELGSKGILLGEIGKEFNNLKFIKTNKREYIHAIVDITNARNYENIVNLIDEALEKKLQDTQEKLEQYKKSNLFKITLIGRLDNEFSINLSVIKEKIQNNYFYLKIVDNTEICLSYDAILEEYSLRGIFARKIKKRILTSKAGVDEKHLFEAFNLGLNCLEGKEVRLDDDY